MFATLKPVLFFLLVFTGNDLAAKGELAILARNWAEKLGGELWHFGEVVTRMKIVADSYKDTTVVKIDGEALLESIHEEISRMMTAKVKAVERIMEVAENSAVKKVKMDPNYTFYNSKNHSHFVSNCTNNTQEEQEVNDDPYFQEVRDYSSYIQQNEETSEETDVEEDNEEIEDKEKEFVVTDGEQPPQASQRPMREREKLPLICNRHFYNIPVNTNYSVVHVPSNVYERSEEVIRDIYWSEELDKTFRNNYKHDPTLSWQYFGSSTGFMRQFPAMVWTQRPIDLFDCRMRSWYIEAASSPKDIVILVDRSGSMTGMRREIARHVVYNILDTLGHNDFVNIFTFSNTTDPLVECFNDSLVQANLENVRLLKESMSEFKTEQIANFSLALTTAFELLATYREYKKGARCNQAIMLITDGVQYNYKEIFEKYNWQNRPFVKARVFTYLIGREVSDVREVKWMACANQGYYVHLSTYAEVREEVLKYIPVMARPMVLKPSRKPNPAWSPVYADVTDPKLTNWLWKNRQRNMQREIFLMHRRNRSVVSGEDMDRMYVHQQKERQDNYGDLQSYRLMTSVSLPVYDLRENATRIANLLGVAGTDIPTENIQVLTMPYKLGVNAYAFIVTNNGFILMHPDLRPVFQGILKPSYNRVDVTEVEIVDDDSEPRDFNEGLKELRRRAVMQEKGNMSLRVKTHLDEMKRVILSRRHYFHTGVNNTPFGLVIALPDRYGFYKVQHELKDDVHFIAMNEKHKLSQYFTGNWSIHPDWRYCRYLDDKHFFETPEEELLHFLKRIGPGWKWGKECDRKLTSSLVADAKATVWFINDIKIQEDNREEFFRRFGLTVVFMATHSGLTRWRDEPQPSKNHERNNHFSLLNNRAIDEVWYKRAVEQHYVDPLSFVYSVPFDAGDDADVLVTATHAIFREDGNRKAPVATVGFQMYHSALHAFFTKITSNCGEISCKRTCASGELYCVVLDDSGFVVVSDHRADTGKFFGALRPDIMYRLVDDGVYKPIRMYDYQGTCFQQMYTGSPARKLLTPLGYFSEMFFWLLSTVMYMLRAVLGENAEVFNPEAGFDEEVAQERVWKEIDPRLIIPKTKPEPCDQILTLFNLVKNISNNVYNRSVTAKNCSWPYAVQPVVGSNMILVVVNVLCGEEPYAISTPDPIQIDYNMSLPCYRELNSNFVRRNYTTCINKHNKESEIKLCGDGSRLAPTLALFVTATLLLEL